MMGARASSRFSKDLANSSGLLHVDTARSRYIHLVTIVPVIENDLCYPITLLFCCLHNVVVSYLKSSRSVSSGLG